MKLLVVVAFVGFFPIHPEGWPTRKLETVGIIMAHGFFILHCVSCVHNRYYLQKHPTGPKESNQPGVYQFPGASM
jgi:hypothetical protein